MGETGPIGPLSGKGRRPLLLADTPDGAFHNSTKKKERNISNLQSLAHLFKLYLCVHFATPSFVFFAVDINIYFCLLLFVHGFKLNGLPRVLRPKAHVHADMHLCVTDVIRQVLLIYIITLKSYTIYEWAVGYLKCNLFKSLDTHATSYSSIALTALCPNNVSPLGRFFGSELIRSFVIAVVTHMMSLLLQRQHGEAVHQSTLLSVSFDFIVVVIGISCLFVVSFFLFLSFFFFNQLKRSTCSFFFSFFSFYFFSISCYIKVLANFFTICTRPGGKEKKKFRRRSHK